MAKQQRPHLTADLGLDSVIAKPGAGPPPPAFHEGPAVSAPPPAAAPPPQPGPDLKAKAIATTFYLLPEDHRRLRRLAADPEVAAQTLLLDALDMLFEQADQGKIQRWEPRRKRRV
jgi:hypothetical protein